MLDIVSQKNKVKIESFYSPNFSTYIAWGWFRDCEDRKIKGKKGDI